MARNQCMGCQAGWPMRGPAMHAVKGGYPWEVVGCTRARYEPAREDTTDVTPKETIEHLKELSRLV